MSTMYIRENLHNLQAIIEQQVRCLATPNERNSMLICVNGKSVGCLEVYLIENNYTTVAIQPHALRKAEMRLVVSVPRLI